MQGGGRAGRGSSGEMVQSFGAVIQTALAFDHPRTEVRLTLRWRAGGRWIRTFGSS